MGVVLASVSSVSRRAAAAAVGAALLLAACGGAGAEPEALERAPEPPSTASTTTVPSSTTVPPTTTTTTTALPPPPTPPAPLPLRAPTLAASPSELAQRVVTAEHLVRDPGAAATSDRAALAGFELQVLYRQLAREPGWDAEVLANTPPDLQLTVRNNAAARRQFRSMHTKLSDRLPAWRIVDPAPAADLLAYYHEAEATFGVPWTILAAVNLVETGMGRIRGTSIAGAQGPMQFMPRTWEAFGGGGDINDPHDAIMGAARYLAHNGGGSGNIAGALWNYNHSDQYVRGVQLYADIMAENPAAFSVFWNWQVVYASTLGDVWLQNGFVATGRVPVIDYVTDHPDHHMGTATN